jgi:hypothetical protein
MRSVFEGGVGSESGGSDDRSRDSGVRDLEEEGLDVSGELPADIIVKVDVMRYLDGVRVGRYCLLGECRCREV